ncbi:ribosome hibernation-promoting factor, HPF/YfiA family [Tissierella creatinophila]|uniref:Ribosome hibernation promoting factor n=1 Tax=Tissierella creatinophila DSM 6911 TaxID=1123403 RepID=A0A1U7M3F6_TISCR|nr:ribosome-associated translation inhibitor RaiA [Tissierella creatinophila]OLS01847.1 putative sigma-54 modulation protein [Tissierella creatinophila DSM 6911]
MNIQFVGKNVEVTDALREVTEKKLNKLEKYFEGVLVGNVTFSTQKNNKTIEVTIDIPGTIIRAEETSDDMYASIDRAIDVLERQIRKYKTKLQKKYKEGQTIRFENVMPLQEEDDDDDKPTIVKTKRFTIKPMNYEEAVLQMELLRHNFFVFRNGDTDDISVIYKRKDGNYGLIEPQN